MILGRDHVGSRPSEEQLLSAEFQGTEMTNLAFSSRAQAQGEAENESASHINEGLSNMSQPHVQEHYSDGPTDPQPLSPESTRGRDGDGRGDGEGEAQPTTLVRYRVYQRRWFGLLQLVLLNIVVSWDVSYRELFVLPSADIECQWLTYAPVTNTTATFFNTTPDVINWLSTAFLFAFVFAAPVVLYTLSRSGPRLAIITASVLLLIGNWMRYGAMRATPASFPLTMAAQVLLGIAQPFVLAAPTRYSDLWFSPRGRVSATALASLANPFGGALGQLVGPFLATSPSDIPNLTLYVAIIASVATTPSIFFPARPPTPVAPSSTYVRPPMKKQITLLTSSANFWLVFIPFSVYVGLFNSISSLLVQILTPYGFSETDGGIAGALLILVGLVAAAISSPIVDRSKRYLLLIKILIPVLALCYLVFIWGPPSRSIAASYVICSVLGAASFSLVPVALEWLVEVSWPVGPELGSTICWTGGQLLGGIFIVISDLLVDGKSGNPPGNMHRALIFQAVLALAVVPLALAIGLVGGEVKNRRLEVDKGLADGSTNDGDVGGAALY